MPTRVVNIDNKGPEIEQSVIGTDESTIEFDGQAYQMSPNSATKLILPDGAKVREKAKVDDSTSTLRNPDSAPVRS